MKKYGDISDLIPLEFSKPEEWESIIEKAGLDPAEEIGVCRLSKTWKDSPPGSLVIMGFTPKWLIVIQDPNET